MVFNWNNVGVHFHVEKYEINRFLKMTGEKHKVYI